MTLILLTGAGFSRNWGGWLASEAFEYLLGCPEIEGDLRRRLWDSQRHGGFEDTLARLQEDYSRSNDEGLGKMLDIFESALAGMFNEMNDGFRVSSFENNQDSGRQIKGFLTKFDAIFTLNQDLLLEHHYIFDNNVILLGNQHWNGGYIPGTKLRDNMPNGYADSFKKQALRTVDEASFSEQGRLQPYYKLHGSSNWMTSSGKRLLVLGGNKKDSIEGSSLLKWYHEKFVEYLKRPNARLMVIGYSFGDRHINDVIINGAVDSNLKIFIIDPQGVEVLDHSRVWSDATKDDDLGEKLLPHFVGASRRSLQSIFTDDQVEFAKIIRFTT